MTNMKNELQKMIHNTRGYVLLILKAGPNFKERADEDPAIHSAALTYHMGLRSKGIFPMVGIIVDNPVVKIVGVLNVQTIADAKKIVELDPSVIAGQYVYELYEWFSIAGDSLPEGPPPSQG